MARKALAIASFGVPFGAAIVAGCSGGGSVVGTIPAKAPTTIPGKPIPQGPLIPVTVLVSPPHRNSATGRRGSSLRKVAGSPPPMIRIGVTVYAGALPSPAPPETIITVAPNSGPYPFVLSIPIGNDTFIVNEYDNNPAGAFAPNGYLLSTFTSTIPVYQNAKNTIAITTTPVANSLTISVPYLSFFENQPASQLSQSVLFTLWDVSGTPIVGPVANPPVVTSSIGGMLPAAGIPLAQSTTLPFTLPGGTNANGTLTTTIAALPFLQPSPVTMAIPIHADWFFLLGDSGNTISAYDAVAATYAAAGPVGTPAPLSGIPAKLVGAVPGCGSNLAQAMIGFSSQTGYLHQIVNIANGAGAMTIPTTAVVSNSDTRGEVLNPGSCTGYFLSTNDSSSGTLYAVAMAAGTAATLPISPNPQASTWPQFLAIDAAGTTLYTADGGPGALASYTIATGVKSYDTGVFTIGSPNGLVWGNGRFYETTNAGYLYSYAPFPDPAPSMTSIGGGGLILAESPDGNAIFLAASATISYYNNTSSVATAFTFQTTLSGAVTAMTVSPDNQTLYAATASGHLYSLPIGSISSSGFGAPTQLFSIPTTTTSLTISP